MKFETAWFDKDDFKYRVRLFDETIKKSLSKEIGSQYEYFVEDPNGEFSTLVDGIKVRKCYGKSKDSQNHYGATSPIYHHIRENYWNNGLYNRTPRVWYLDIETRALGEIDPQNAPYQIVLIQILDSFSKTMIVLGLRDWKMDSDYKLDYPVKYIRFDTEVELLKGYLKIFKTLDPLIIYAWNGVKFDFPYIFNRLKNLGLDNQMMSNYGFVDNFINKQGESTFKANGHCYYDLIDVYKFFVKAPRSYYSLDYISKVELKAKKVEHPEFDDFDSFYTGAKYTISDEPYKEKYRELIRQGMIKRKNLKVRQTVEKIDLSKEIEQNEKELMSNINFQFVYYGIVDVILLKKIDDKLNFTNQIVMIAQMMGILPSEVLATIKPWSQYLSNVALQNNQVMPKKIESDDFDINFISYDTQQKIAQYLSECNLPFKQKMNISLLSQNKNLMKTVSSELALIGGYVMAPEKGKHKWVVNFDVNSMYPMLAMATFNMSPETYVPQEKLPNDLRILVNKYMSGQKDEDKLNLDPKILAQITTLLKKYNLSMALNGACFRRDKQGIIPRLVTEIYSNRKKDKKMKQRYESKKVLINKILTERHLNEQ